MPDPKKPQQGPTKATPEENAMLEKAAKVALAPLATTGPEAKAIDDQIMASGDMPERNLAMMANALVDQGVQAVGGIDDMDMMEALAQIVISELTDQAVEMGAVNFQQMGVEESEFLQIVLFEFLKQWAEKNPDKLDDEDRRALAEMQGGGQPQQPQQGPQQQMNPAAQGVQQANGSLSQARGM